MRPRQMQCLDYVRRHGGKLKRFEGGRWAAPDEPTINGKPLEFFGTVTVKSLVSQGKLVEQGRSANRNGWYTWLVQLPESEEGTA